MQTNSTINHKSPKEKGQLERMIFSRLLVLSGIFIFLIGLYFMLSTADLIHKVQQYYHSFFSPSTTNTVYVVNSISLLSLFLYFLPGFCILILSILFSKKYKILSYSASILAAVYFAVVQIKLVHGFIFHGIYFHNFSEGSVFLISSLLLLLVSVFTLKKVWVLYLSSIYIHLTSLLFIIGFGGEMYLPLFAFLFLFDIVAAWLEGLIKKPTIHVLNYLFSFILFGFFFVRKFIVNSKTEFLPLFFVFGGLFFLLFYLIPLVSSGRKEKSLSHGMQLVLTGFNLFFYLGTTSFVLLKYYNYGSFCLFIPVLALAGGAGYYLITKFQKQVWSLPYAYVLIILSALVLPVWIQDSKILLFTGVFSLLMLYYAIHEKQKLSFWVSVSALVLATLGYLLVFINLIPALLTDHKSLQTYLLLKGILTSFYLLGVFWSTKWLVREAELPVSEKKMSSHKYRKIIDAFMLSGLFVTVGLIIFLIPYFITHSVSYIGLSWFVSGSLFFVYFVRFFKGKKMALKKPTHYAGFLFAMLYPFLTTVRFLNYNVSKTLSLDTTAIIMHYITLMLFLVLSLSVLKRIRKRNSANIFMLRIIQLLVLFYILFIAFEEYNNLSIIIEYLARNHDLLEFAPLFLTINFYFPFTILLSVFATSVNIYAIVKQDTFLRIVSLVLIVIAIVKLFVLDKGAASEDSTGAIFIIAGIMLVILAVLNSWLVNSLSKGKQ